MLDNRRGVAYKLCALQNPEAHYLTLSDEPLEELDPPLAIFRWKVELPSNATLLGFFNNHGNIL